MALKAARCAVLLFALWSMGAARGHDTWVVVEESDCSPEPKPIADLQQVEILGRCETDDPAGVVRIEVTNRAPEDRGPLQALTIAFCGDDVRSAEQPEGWEAELTRSERRTAIEWRVEMRTSPHRALRSGRSATGFVVRLRLGWRRSGVAMAQWESSLVGGGAMSCDCLRAADRR